MEPSSPAKSETPIPEGVDVNDLYDGPRVVALPSGRAAFLGNQQGASTVGGPEQPPATTGASLLAPIPAAARPPQVSTTEDVKSEYPALITLALDVLSARLLGLIALVTACLVWAGVIWNPEMWRIVAAGAFSILVFLPAMAMYWRAGMAGEGETQ